MPYYPTLAEDIARAKEILARGKADPADMPVAMREVAHVPGGTIFGVDVYAAYKLLESFVEVIDTLSPQACETALRHKKLAQHDDAPPPSITCPRCGRTSYNRHDIEQRYCGACHLFHDQMVVLAEGDTGADAMRALEIGECVCRTRGCGHGAALHVGGICQACACEGWS